MTTKVALALALLATAAGCGDDGTRAIVLPSLSVPEGCNPLLAGADCFLPYPSDFFRVADPASASGARIETRGAAKLHTANGKSADVADWRTIEGYSRSASIVGTLLAPTSAEGVVGVFDSPARSLEPRSSATLLVDAASGALVPHFADLDPRTTDASRQAIVLHPLAPLAGSTRYLVAFHRLVSPEGAPVRAPEGFRRLRDGEAAGDLGLAPLVDRYEGEIFPALEALGVLRRELQLAWDFTTGADASVTGDMLRVRELTLAWLAANVPEVTIDGVDEHAGDDGSGIWRTVSGHVRGPRFVDSADPGAALVRDGDGRVRQDGTASFPFLAQVPWSLRDGARGAGRIVGLGHGFFGSRSEVRGGSALQSANALGAVVISIDWWGMSSEDLPGVIAALTTNPSQVLAFSDRVHQAMANWLTLTAALRGPLGDAPAFRRPESGAPLYDAHRVDFWGLSNGAVLGTIQSSLNPWNERVCLNVGGAGWTQLMWRSQNFLPFLVGLEVAIPDALVQQAYVASLQRHFDHIDPATYAPLLFDGTISGSPADRRVLLQMGLGDTQVPNIGSFYLARAMGAGITTPTPADVWGVDPLANPTAPAGLTVFDLGVDTSFSERAQPPLTPNPVHNGVRLLSAADRQLDALFRDDARIIHPCDGACDPG